MAGKGGGGAWKVAYADFVTAMMALFLVLWITAQDKKVKEAIELTFKHPFMRGPRQSSGIIPNTLDTMHGKTLEGQYDTPSPLEMDMLRHLNDDLLKVLGTNPEYQRNQSVQIEFTDKGLNISVLNRVQKPVFEPGTDTFTEYGHWVFSTLAWEISRYKEFAMEIEGHSPRGETNRVATLDKWDLTAGRANAARRVLVGNGVDPDQVAQVTGFADTEPMRGSDASDEVNSRVTIALVIRPRDQLQALKSQ
ncbi:MAG TPA: flagellar motor protein MotB [Verrucomicrobiae bacterium]|nr:flagellar motor protein MotB [Verrucomicrobiae bacterium]